MPRRKKKKLTPQQRLISAAKGTGLVVLGSAVGASFLMLVPGLSIMMSSAEHFQKAIDGVDYSQD